MKNRRHALKNLIESCGDRPDDCVVENWESMICLITSTTKQNEVAKNYAMHALIIAPSHFSCGGEVGVVEDW